MEPNDFIQKVTNTEKRCSNRNGFLLKLKSTSWLHYQIHKLNGWRSTRRVSFNKPIHMLKRKQNAPLELKKDASVTGEEDTVNKCWKSYFFLSGITANNTYARKKSSSILVRETTIGKVSGQATQRDKSNYLETETCAGVQLHKEETFNKEYIQIKFPHVWNLLCEYRKE